MTEGCLCHYVQFTRSNTGCGSQTFQEIRTENVPDGHSHPMKKPLTIRIQYGEMTKWKDLQSAAV